MHPPFACGCGECGYSFLIQLSTPMALDSQQQASADQFSKQAAHYGRTHVLANTADVDKLLAHIPERERHGRALDIATGGGHCALALARAGYSLTLGDVAQPMLDKAAALLGEEGYRCEAESFPAERIPFPDASFQLVSSRVAPHHFSDAAAFVRESARVLAPGGWFLLIDGSVPDDDPETEEWIHQIEKLRDPSHSRLLSRKRWIGLAEENGLQIIHQSLERMLQPDLEWYFSAADTPAENRAKVHELIESANGHVRAAMCLSTSGPVTWQWQRLSLLAKKAD